MRRARLLAEVHGPRDRRPGRNARRTSGRRPELRAAGDELGDVSGAQQAVEVEVLSEVATEPAELSQLIGVLDALGDDGESEIVGERHEGANDRAVRRPPR